MQMKLSSQQEKVNALRQEVAEMNKEREFWQQVRIQASIAIVQGWASTPQGITKNYMKGAVELADALIAELKKGGEE